MTRNYRQNIHMWMLSLSLQRVGDEKVRHLNDSEPSTHARQLHHFARLIAAMRLQEFQNPLPNMVFVSAGLVIKGYVVVGLRSGGAKEGGKALACAPMFPFPKLEPSMLCICEVGGEAKVFETREYRRLCSLL